MSTRQKESKVFTLQFLKPQQFKTAFLRMKTENSSMRGRFAAYVLLQLCAIIAFVLLLLNLFGILNPVSNRLEQELEHQLNSSAAVIEEDIDALASYATVFSNQLSTLLSSSLSDLELTFEGLSNNPGALTELQSDAYLTVYNNMRIAPCSGAFYFLNTTVNSNLNQSYYNGLYLKVANLSSENTIHSKACLFRGSSAVARENDINLHSTWQNETAAGAFTEIDAMMKDGVSSPYLLTKAYQLPDTWERARFVCVPIFDEQGNRVGVCGFEISDLLFKLSHKTVSADQTYMVCALLDETEDGYTGQISGSKSGYTPPVEDTFILESGKHLTTIRCGELIFYGKVREITIGDISHTLVVMVPKTQYDSCTQSGTMKIVLLLLIVTAVAVFSSMWLSKKYVSPILDGLEQIKTEDRSDIRSSIPEISDLFVFLAEQDRQHEESLDAVTREKQSVQQEKDDLQIKYEQAQQIYDEAQAEYVKAQSDLADAKKELDRLSYSRKTEIDPDDYQAFLDGVQTLTRAEREIFEWYLEGKTANEILELAGIKQGTLKFHNHNILGKLGVSSRKQMLRYAALMKQQEQGGLL